MPPTGARGTQPLSPGNLTGVIFKRQRAEQEAREKAASIDIAQVRRESFEAGREQGYAKGLEDGWDACIAALVAEGILAADPDEDQADED
jgi:hypothetical protein